MALIGDVWLSPAMLPALCRLVDAHRTTARRWYERRRLPAAVYRLLEIAWHGRIERIHAAWSGWNINPRTGELVTPDGWTLTAGELAAVPLRYQELAALRAQLLEHPLVARQRFFNPRNIGPLRAPGAGERAQPGDGADHGRREPVHGAGAYRRRLRALTTRPPLAKR